MKTSAILPLLLLASTACRPNVVLTIVADKSAVEDGLKDSANFELSIFLYSAADEDVVNDQQTLNQNGDARFKLNPGTLDLYAVSADNVDPPESCDTECTGYWEGETVNLVVPQSGHIEESVTVFAVCDC